MVVDGHENCAFHGCIDKSGLIPCRQLKLQQAYKIVKGMCNLISMNVATSRRSRLGEYNINLK